MKDENEMRSSNSNSSDEGMAAKESSKLGFPISLFTVKQNQNMRMNDFSKSVKQFT